MMRAIRQFLVRLLERTGGLIFSPWTMGLMLFDLKRLIARLKNWRRYDLAPPYNRLHLGCGWRHIPGWLNVDVRHSDHDVDLANGRLPWRTNAFTAIVSQHTIEHLELMRELLPLLRELNRVLIPGGEIWLSCPDIEKLVHSYLNHHMTDLLQDRMARIPSYQLGPMPAKHLLNDIFFAKGEHRNLFDFTLLSWALEKAGFSQIEQVSEADLLCHFPDFPRRGDDRQTLYVRATKPTSTH